jgi:transglutaminase-like putative cysteine protease
VRYQITHLTRYSYHASIAISHHQFRLIPRDHRRQKLLSQNLHVDPAPHETAARFDYHGNPVLFATIDRGHNELSIRSQFEVDLTPTYTPPPAETPAWEHIRDEIRGLQQGAALEAAEFLFDSPLVKSNDDFADYARPSFHKGRPILEAVLDLAERIHRDFKFDPTATDVSTPVTQVLKDRRGVCQDFAHLQIACLRSIGLPARYVSGYLNTIPPPGQPKLAGADASHAWVSFYCDAHGWIDIDPTNNQIPNLEHITVAWGRDYSDVSPVRGVVLGSAGHAQKVSVYVKPTEPIPQPKAV